MSTRKSKVSISSTRKSKVAISKFAIMIPAFLVVILGIVFIFFHNETNCKNILKKMKWPKKDKNSYADTWSGTIDNWYININLNTNKPGWERIQINGHDIFSGDSSMMMDNKEIHDFFRCAVQLRTDANMIEFDESVNKYVKKNRWS